MRMNRRHRAGAVLVAAFAVAAGCAVQEWDTQSRSLGPATATATPTQDTAPAAVTPDRPTQTPTQTTGPPRAWIQPAETYARETSTPTAVDAPVQTTSAAPGTTRPASTPAPRRTTATPPRPTTVKPTTSRPTTPAQATTQRPVTPVRNPPTTTTQGNAIRIGSWSHGYVSAYGSQASLDRCNLVEWSPMWFAGHNYCGYAFWASLDKGRTITITGDKAGMYTVSYTVYVPYQGGPKPALPPHDLALQTCKGSGTQIILAEKTG